MTRTVRDLREDDLPAVERILESRIRDPETGEVLAAEVADVIERMRFALRADGSMRILAAVSPEGEIAGVVGMRSPTSTMEPFASGERPVEMVHAFVAVRFERRGYGSALTSALEDRARRDGYDEVLLNSGPRYAASGWGFFDRLAGFDRRGLLRDFYGPAQDAPVWGKRL
jgi:ribosomal protein S18 acetylase RimI-like enzyme